MKCANCRGTGRVVTVINKETLEHVHENCPVCKGTGELVKMCEACSGESIIAIRNDEIKASATFDGIAIEIFDCHGDFLIWDVAYCPFCGRKIDEQPPTTTP